MKQQVNVEIPEGSAKRVKKDAINMGVSLNEYALQAFEKFLSMPVAQRRIYFGDRKQKKVFGRRISV